MKKILAILAFLLVSTLPLPAQDWSLGVRTGPFIFGDFYERRLRPITSEGPDEPITLTLSAATRAGLAVDLERSFSERWAARLEGTFTHSKLAIKQTTGDNGVEFDAGDMDVTTFAVPIVFRINPKGTFRFHGMGGPAYASYKTRGFNPGTGTVTDTSHEWGITYGAGVGWWFNDRFALEGTLTDIVTTSPFSELEDADLPGLKVKRPHNVHTTVGLRWRF
jgi:hypothetical protein